MRFSRYCANAVAVKSGGDSPDVKRCALRCVRSRFGDRNGVKLVACANCHTQYDVSDVAAKTFPCRCGAILENRPPAPIDAEVRRCGACGALATAGQAVCEYCNSEIVRDTRNLSLICPECYARNAEDSKFCTACGIGFRPEAVRTEGHELPCPVCSSLMPPRQVGGVGVNECASCNGLWVPGENFDLLVSRAMEARRNADPVQLQTLKPRTIGSNPAAQKIVYRKCPECDGYMQRRNFRKSSGVIIDRCAAHGTWLDADELEQIAGFILSGGQPAECLVEVPSGPKPAPHSTQRSAITSMRSFGRSSGRDDDGILGSMVGVLFELLK